MLDGPHLLDEERLHPDRYYVCQRAQKRGWHTCPSKSIPAQEIERLVVEQIRAIGRDPALLNATLAHARKQAQDSIAALESERAILERDLKRHYREVRTLAVEVASSNGAAPSRATSRPRCVGIQ